MGWVPTRPRPPVAVRSAESCFNPGICRRGTSPAARQSAPGFGPEADCWFPAPQSANQCHLGELGQKQEPPGHSVPCCRRSSRFPQPGIIPIIASAEIATGIVAAGVRTESTQYFSQRINNCVNIILYIVFSK